MGYIKNAGAYSQVIGVFFKQSGAYIQATGLYRKIAGAYVSIYNTVIEIITIVAAFYNRVIADTGNLEGLYNVEKRHEMAEKSESLDYIPSGFKSGLAYSLTPSNGNGDLISTRASVGTRFDENGILVEEAAGVPRVDFSENANNAITGPDTTNIFNYSWDLSKWSTQNSTIAVSPTEISLFGSRAYTVTATNNSFVQFFLNQTIDIDSYVISVWVKKVNHSSIALRHSENNGSRIGFNLDTNSQVNFDGLTTVKGTYLKNGWRRVDWFFTSVAAGKINLYFDENYGSSAVVGSQLLIGGIKLEPGTEARPYVPTNGAPRTITKKDLITGSKLLIEPIATNYLPSSENWIKDASNWQYNVQYATFNNNAAIAPDGQNTACLVVPTTDSNSFQGFLTSAVNGFNAGDIITASCFIKPEKYSIVLLGGAFGNENATFDVSKGIVTFEGSQVLRTKIIKYKNGWYRCIVTYTFTNPIGNTGLYAGARIRNNEGSNLCDGIGGVYFWGYMFNLGYDVSYIKTNGSTVTRSSEKLSLTGLDSKGIINLSSTIYLDLDMEDDNNFSVRFNGATNSNLIRFYGNDLRYRDSGLVEQGFIPFFTGKLVIRIDGNNIKVWHNGAVVIEASDYLAEQIIDFESSQYSHLTNKKELRHFKIFPTALTNAQCYVLSKNFQEDIKTISYNQDADIESINTILLNKVSPFFGDEYFIFSPMASKGLTAFSVVNPNNKHNLVADNRASAGSYVDKDLIIREAPAGLVRIDNTRGSGTVLLERGETNYLYPSEPVSAPFSDLVTTYEAYNWEALGFSSAVKFSGGVNAEINYFYDGLPATESATISAYIRMDDLSEPVIGLDNLSGDFSFIVAGQICVKTPIVQRVGDTNIYRVMCSHENHNGTGSNYGIYTYPGQSGKGFRVTGFQMEWTTRTTPNALISSYIKTTNSTVTRSQEMAYMDITPLTSAQGSIFLQMDVNGESSSDIHFRNAAGNYRGFYFAGLRSTLSPTTGSSTTDISANLGAFKRDLKIAFIYDGVDMKFYVNGALKQTIPNSEAAPLEFNNIRFNPSNSGVFFIREVRAYTRKLTDAEAILLTTPL